MGSSLSHLACCFSRHHRKYGDGGMGVPFSEPLDEGLGHSFCYVRPSPLANSPLVTPDMSEEFPALYNGGKQQGPVAVGADETDADAGDILTSSKLEEKEVDLHSDRVRSSATDRPRPSFETKNAGNEKVKTIPETHFRAISGASVSANTATPRSMLSCEQFNSFSNFLYDRAAAFESTSSFSHIPLQPVPKGFSGPFSGPLDKVDRGFLSGPLDRERGFMSGPLERGFMSGPLEKGFLSGPLDPSVDRSHYSAPLNGAYPDGGYSKRRSRRKSFTRFMTGMSAPMKKAFAKTASSLASTHKSIVAPVKNYILSRESVKDGNDSGARKKGVDPIDPSVEFSYSDADMRESERLQWAQGKAGEDRVHVVISEEQGWVFVGIYDGFNGPDAPDFLMSNLYPAIAQELQGLLYDSKEDEANFSGREAEEFEASLESETAEEIEGEIERVGCWRSPKAHGDVLQAAASSRQEDDAREIDMVHGSDTSQNGHTDSAVEKDIPRLDLDDGGLVGSAEEMHNHEGQSEKSRRPCSASSASGDQDGRETTHAQSGREDEDSHVSSDGQFSTAREEHMADRSGNGLGYGMENERTLEQPQLSEASSVTDADYKGKKKSTSSAIKPRNDHERGINKYVRWRCDWAQENVGLVQKMKSAKVAQDPDSPSKESAVEHAAVLRALARALDATENSYLDMADTVLYENPELALMGSCVLVMVMKDEDVYIMNVGDSRAVLAQHPKVEPFSTALGKGGRNGLHGNDAGARDPLLRLELERIIEETPMELEALEGTHENGGAGAMPPSETLVLGALQLTTDHSTCIEEEVLRLRAEHPDEDVIENDRVKGKLKVTRAFGAGYLKQPKWNNALLEMFQIKFIGTTPYMTCAPSLHHHRLGPQDEFLVLSSDGLYQYFSNEEVVSQVEQFMKMFPDGDPAQHLIEELLFRAAKKAGMDFHELLDIPQGDRRKYHDDVSVMVISLEGRIWRSYG